MSQHSGDAGPASYCGLCGDPQEGALRTGDWHRKETFDGGTAPPSDVQWAPRTTGTEDAHETCRARLQLEPPRYCGQCGRRLKVQVTPLSWRASCSRHGVATS